MAWACPKEFLSARSGKRTGTAITSNEESKYLRASRGTFLAAVRAGTEYQSGLAPKFENRCGRENFCPKELTEMVKEFCIHFALRFF